MRKLEGSHTRVNSKLNSGPQVTNVNEFVMLALCIRE